MSHPHLESIRHIVRELMASRGVNADVGDDDSLFVSGRLDSVAAIDLIMRLETDFGVDFSSTGFDASMIDSVAEIVALANSAAVAP
jgi:acyl carrier protein